jgi:hypothetical protein
MVCTVLWASSSIFGGTAMAIELPHGGGHYSHSPLPAQNPGIPLFKSLLYHTRYHVIFYSRTRETYNSPIELKINPLFSTNNNLRTSTSINLSSSKHLCTIRPFNPNPAYGYRATRTFRIRSVPLHTHPPGLPTMRQVSKGGYVRPAQTLKVHICCKSDKFSGHHVSCECLRRAWRMVLNRSHHMS